MAPTMADVLALPALTAGGARVVAGAARLDTPVRWAHVAEIPEIPTLLSLEVVASKISPSHGRPRPT